MSDLPRTVTIHEEGPREGFQSAPGIYPVADKLRLIDALAATGLHEIQCTSFVNPGRVPQMADAEQLAAGLQRRPGVRYTGLWLNERGFDRAVASGLDISALVITSASSTFALKNNGCDAAELTRRQADMVAAYRAQGI
ncbi:MAG: hydroxymethylglutaryl-CoA lyase, partial [Comamonadaceae bacterium]